MALEIFRRVGNRVKRQAFRVQSKLDLWRTEVLLKAPDSSDWINLDAAELFMKDLRLQKLADEILHVEAETEEERMAKLRKLVEGLSPAQHRAVIMIQGELLRERLDKLTGKQGQKS